MNDPILIIPVLCAAIFCLGYAAAWLQTRALIRRYERSYGSLITRSR